LNKKRNIKLSPIILLIIYAVSMYPTIVFHKHEHEHEIVAYEDATACEKTIYYGEDSHHCGHEKHISEKDDQCSLSDHHFFALYPFEFSVFRFCKAHFTLQYYDFYKSALANYSSLYFNKGPPVIYFFDLLLYR
jgi:hypothetical protein